MAIFPKTQNLLQKRDSRETFYYKEHPKLKFLGQDLFQFKALKLKLLNPLGILFYTLTDGNSQNQTLEVQCEALVLAFISFLFFYFLFIVFITFFSYFNIPLRSFFFFCLFVCLVVCLESLLGCLDQILIGACLLCFWVGMSMQARACICMLRHVYVSLPETQILLFLLSFMFKCMC